MWLNEHYLLSQPWTVAQAPRIDTVSRSLTTKLRNTVGSNDLRLLEYGGWDGRANRMADAKSENRFMSHGIPKDRLFREFSVIREIHG